MCSTDMQCIIVMMVANYDDLSNLTVSVTLNDIFPVAAVYLYSPFSM